MTQEIVRALVDGVWVTEVAIQGGGGGSQAFLTGYGPPTVAMPAVPVDQRIILYYQDVPPSTGTFTLTFEGDTTEAIDFDATASEIVSALELLGSIGAGNILTQNAGFKFPGNQYIYFRFANDLGGQSLSAVTIDNDTDGDVATNTDQEGGPGEAVPQNPPDVTFAAGDRYVDLGTITTGVADLWTFVGVEYAGTEWVQANSP